MGQFVIALNPISLDHRAAGRDRHLLILRRERVAAELKLQVLEHRKRLTHGRKRLAGLAADRLSVSDIGMSSSTSAIAGRLRTSHSSDWLVTKPVRSSMWTRCMTMTIAPVRLSSRRDSSVFVNH